MPLLGVTTVLTIIFLISRGPEHQNRTENKDPAGNGGNINASTPLIVVDFPLVAIF